jgi:S1-C subfamily serine protease
VTRRRLLPIVAGLAVLFPTIGGAWWYAGQRAIRRDVAQLAAGLEIERTRREALDRQIAETAERLETYRQDVRALLEVRRDEVHGIERTVRALETERNASERIIHTYASGVPLIQGVVGYEDAAGRTLRHVGVDARGRLQRNRLGWPRMSADGPGPVVRTTFLGTGFLASSDGTILTSRHMARPWDSDPELANLLEEEGVRPQVIQLRAFFPGVPDPVPLSVVKASVTRGVIVLRGSPPRSVPALPIDLEGTDAMPGRPVMVLGYPAGLHLLLARVAPDLLEMLIDRSVTEITDESVDVPALIEKLSRLNQIRPYPTWGRLADVRPHQLAHDAGTGLGGSGGPIFALSGRVIGLSTAMARDFDGAALGVPIGEAMSPQTRARGKVPEPGK